MKKPRLYLVIVEQRADCDLATFNQMTEDVFHLNVDLQTQYMLDFLKHERVEFGPYTAEIAETLGIAAQNRMCEVSGTCHAIKLRQHATCTK